MCRQWRGGETTQVAVQCSRVHELTEPTADSCPEYVAYHQAQYIKFEGLNWRWETLTAFNVRVYSFLGLKMLNSFSIC